MTVFGRPHTYHTAPTANAAALAAALIHEDRGMLMMPIKNRIHSSAAMHKAGEALTLPRPRVDSQSAAAITMP